MKEPFWIYVIGFLAQGFFSARILVQWLMSERAKRVLSPTVFWVLSIIGSYLLCIYGWLRDDFAIVLGQCISYYIYPQSLHLEKIKIRLTAVELKTYSSNPVARCGRRL